MDERQRDDVIAEGAARLEAAILAAQQLADTDDFWAAAWEAEQIRGEVESATGVSLCDPAPPRVVNAVVEGAAHRTVEQVAAFLDATSRNDHGGVGGTVAP